MASSPFIKSILIKKCFLISASFILEKSSLSLLVKNAVATVITPDHCILIQSVVLATRTTHIVHFGAAMLILTLHHLLVLSPNLLLHSLYKLKIINIFHHI